MKLIPGVTVTMVQQCSGHDGAWSAKKEYYEISLDVGKKLFKAIDKDKPATVAGDCTLIEHHADAYALVRFPAPRSRTRLRFRTGGAYSAVTTSFLGRLQRVR